MASATSTCSASDVLTWHTLHTYSSKFDFHWGIQKPEYVVLTSISSEDRVNGNPVVREVRLNDALQVEVFIAGRKVPLKSLNLFTSKVNTIKDLNNILYLVALGDLCRGFSVASEKKSRDRSGNVTGECEQWTTGAEKSLRHRSVKCESPLSISSKSAMCPSCKHVRSSWSKYLSNTSSASDSVEKSQTKKRKREDLMDKEELVLKLREEKRLKRNAQRREAYLREKINVEMLEFDEEDNQDFKLMFSKIPREKLQEDQLIFWEEQEKAIKTKGARGHRWHPK